MSGILTMVSDWALTMAISGQSGQFTSIVCSLSKKRLTVATSTLLATGSADNTIKLWKVRDGTCLHTWEFPTAVKRVEFSEDGTMLLAVTEQRMGHSGSVVVFLINEDGPRISSHMAELIFLEAEEPIATIPTQESKATVAGWSFFDRYIIMGHENGMVSQWDWKVIFATLLAKLTVVRRDDQERSRTSKRKPSDRSPIRSRQNLFHHRIER